MLISPARVVSDQQLRGLLYKANAARAEAKRLLLNELATLVVIADHVMDDSKRGFEFPLSGGYPALIEAIDALRCLSDEL